MGLCSWMSIWRECSRCCEFLGQKPALEVVNVARNKITSIKERNRNRSFRRNRSSCVEARVRKTLKVKSWFRFAAFWNGISGDELCNWSTRLKDGNLMHEQSQLGFFPFPVDPFRSVLYRNPNGFELLPYLSAAFQSLAFLASSRFLISSSASSASGSSSSALPIIPEPDIIQ